jgi:membrane-bound lytic murein transglycosylase C
MGCLFYRPFFYRLFSLKIVLPFLVIPVAIRRYRFLREGKPMFISTTLRGVILGAACIVAPTALLWAQDDFEAFQRQDRQEQQQFNQAETAAFEAFRLAEEKAFEEFKAQVERQWGEYTASTRTDWVEYAENLGSRSQVDFDAGSAKVEVLIEAATPAEAQQQAEEKLQVAIETLVKDQGKSSDYSVDLPNGRTDKPAPLAAEPVLKGQVQTTAGQPVTAQNAAVFARQTVRSEAVKTEPVQGKDGKTRIKATVSFPLVGDHMRRRALQYAPIVHKYAKRFDLDPALVFAVIHTESSFNPKARSGAPAYGLMQLVPTSGGRDAYRFVYRQDKVLPASYFYDPERNIELGCGYLHHLQKRVFKVPMTDRKGLYCSVAAYNTGAGNVSRVFTGNTNLSKALPLIWKYEPEALYAKLVADLPYKETRLYLRKVFDRIPL